MNKCKCGHEKKHHDKTYGCQVGWENKHLGTRWSDDKNARCGCPKFKENKTDVSIEVVKPAHYNQGDVECIDAIKAATTGLSGFEGYLTGNAIKYIWRWKVKHKEDPKKDLDKAIWYLNKLKGEIK
jgi:hypothetical protein